MAAHQEFINRRKILLIFKPFTSENKEAIHFRAHIMLRRHATSTASTTKAWQSSQSRYCTKGCDDHGLPMHDCLHDCLETVTHPGERILLTVAQHRSWLCLAKLKTARKRWFGYGQHGNEWRIQARQVECRRNHKRRRKRWRRKRTQVAKVTWFRFLEHAWLEPSRN